MDDEIRIRISDIIFAMKKHWKLIAITSITGTMLGLLLTAMSYMQSSLVTYKIVGSFAISTMNESGNYTSNLPTASKDDYYLAEAMVPAIRYVLNSSLVVGAAIRDENLSGIKPSDIQTNVSLSQYGDTQIIDFGLIWRNPEEGIDIWNAMINAGNRYIPKILQLGTLVIINEPEATQMGVSRAGPNLAMLLCALGLMAGMGFAMISTLLHPTLNNIKDVGAVLHLETIGVIPESLNWSERNGSILSRKKNTEVDESYSAATHILRNRLGRKEQHHCFYVTSTTSKEGKSVVAAKTAIQLSRMECRTLLIDFDSRTPDIGAMFLADRDYACSLNAFYRGEAIEHDVITHIDGYLDLIMMLPEHNLIPFDGTIADFFAGLIDKYEYVIINASPVGVVSDTLSLNQVTNNALLVVGYDMATISDIQTAIQKMDKSGTRMIGCVVNGVKGRIESEHGIHPPFRKNKAQKNHQLLTEEVWPEKQESEVMEDLMNLTKKPSAARAGAREGATEEQASGKRKRGWKKRARSGADRSPKASPPHDVMDDLLPDAGEEAQGKQDET